LIATPDAAGSDAPGWESPADDVADEEVDVLYLAGQCPSGKGAWLWVTTADARREASSPACSCRAPGRWDRLDLDGWPERVRATAVFAVGVLKELQEHGG
jgi:hypothetical protein